MAKPMTSKSSSPPCQAQAVTKDWQVLRPHKAGQLVLNALPFAEHMAVLLRENALPRIELISLVDDKVTDIAFDEEAFDVSFGAMAEYDSAQLRFTYASMTTPTQTFDFDMNSGKRVLRKTQTVPSGHEAGDYITRRITATGHDGAQSPFHFFITKTQSLTAVRRFALWLWLLRHHHSGRVFGHPIEPC